MGRTKNSVLNVSSSFIVLLCRTVMSFIVRTVFIKTLGADDLGLNGLFTNIISMLSLTELGVGVAINYSLYKPLAHKDYHKVSILLSFYKRIYRWIGIIMSSIGLLLIPFLQYIIGDVVVNGEIILIYLLYLFNATSMYFISYKETLIFADQQTYKLFNINFITWMAVYILQIISLFL
ncbi:hypothetical protein LJC02_03835, partial [Breznakia sp. OttesenSCG-928-G09]|nr:hypothetical protein [Breznakia sp. OttesenSCG-928-G09]